MFDNAVERILIAELYEDKRVLEGDPYDVHDLDGKIKAQGEHDGEHDHGTGQPYPKFLQVLHERHFRVFERGEDPILHAFEEFLKTTARHAFPSTYGLITMKIVLPWRLTSKTAFSSFLILDAALS